MGYCTAAQVQLEFKELTFSATSAVKSAQVDEFIAEADAEIDSIIGVTYQLPIVGTQPLLLLRRISRALVADRVAGILEVRTGDPKTSQTSSRMTREEALEIARGIAEGTILFDAVETTAAKTGVVYSEENASGRVFKKDEKQW